MEDDGIAIPVVPSLVVGTAHLTTPTGQPPSQDRPLTECPQRGSRKVDRGGERHERCEYDAEERRPAERLRDR